MYTDTVTVFNRYGSAKKGYTWYPTVIKGVDLTIDKGANIKTMGVDSADTAKLHVKYSNSYNSVIVGSKEYATPKVWEAMDETSRMTTVTFSEGIDYFIAGEYMENPIDDSAYITGVGSNGFIDVLMKNNDHVFMITNVGTYKLIPHFEIGGA